MTPKLSEQRSLIDLRRMKREGTPIAALTAYDASFARIVDRMGVDVVLVGDSLGMVVQGHDTTLPVTVDEMVYHARAAMRGISQSLVMVDLPFLSFTDPETALASAGRILKETGAQMVKLEGTSAQADVVRSLSREGIPVCGHVGLTPQSVHKLGGYRIQGRDEASAEKILDASVALEEAGADILIVECIPSALAGEITRTLEIPVIGIGSGVDCDGQILVLYDLLGVTRDPPSFARDFLADGGGVAAAVERYVREVKARRFPAPGETPA